MDWLFGGLAEDEAAVEVAEGQAAFLARAALVLGLGFAGLLAHHRLFFH